MNASTRRSRWSIAALVAGALLVGSVIGPTVVQAATAGLVRLEGGGSSHVAKISASGQLSVNPGLSQTAAHQILAVQASPSSYVTAIGLANCSKGGIYKIPRGDAFILTGADFDNISTDNTNGEQFAIKYGPSASPCTFFAADAGSDALLDTQNQVFQPGIAIPAGDAIGLFGQNDSGAVQIYGYLVPASTVRRHAATAGLGRVSLNLRPTR
jgi:hypothetical protein